MPAARCQIAQRLHDPSAYYCLFSPDAGTAAAEAFDLRVIYETI